MPDQKVESVGVDWIEMARGLGGLAAVLALLAHLLIPAFQFDIVRVQILLILIGVLLELDEIIGLTLSYRGNND
jgi:hypothetical protein